MISVCLFVLLAAIVHAEDNPFRLLGDGVSSLNLTVRARARVCV